MKKLLITATIFSMLFTGVNVSASADTSARLSGIYEAYNEVKVICDGEIGSVVWQKSNSENGTYSDIADAEGESYILQNADSGKWIKAVVTDGNGDTVQTEPRYVEEAWNTRQNAQTVDSVPNLTPSKYLFAVDGMEFILLDVTEDEESKFIVMTKNSVGYRPYSTVDGGQAFSDMTGFLNNLNSVDFYYNGNLSSTEMKEDYENTGYKGNSDFIQLPKVISDAIDNSRFWKTEPVRSGQAKERVFKGGITLPSATDVKKYGERIGWRDDNPNLKTETDAADEPKTVDFWLRPPSNQASQAIYANAAVLGGLVSKAIAAEDTTVGIRLMFGIDEDFFINNKIENPGQEVLNVLWKEYSKAELMNVYTQEELTALGYIDFSIDGFSVVCEEDNAKAVVKVNSRLTEEKSVVILVAAYDDNGMLVGAVMDSLACIEGMNEKELTLNGVNSGNYASATAVIIDSAENPAPVYKAVHIN